LRTAGDGAAGGRNTVEPSDARETFVVWCRRRAFLFRGFEISVTKILWRGTHRSRLLGGPHSRMSYRGDEEVILR